MGPHPSLSSPMAGRRAKPSTLSIARPSCSHRGYVVMAPNGWGSTGYGRAYEQANRHDIRERDLEDDAWAAKFLAASRYADPTSIGATGGSGR
jgi:prolyl oligopeptidase PreP (S9A serine peptidase family)